MSRGTFHIIGFDEGGVRGTPDNQRLVCVLDGGAKLAIWGSEESCENIVKVARAGLPCTIECEYREPGEVQARKFGHTHWVREDFELKIVK